MSSDNVGRTFQSLSGRKLPTGNVQPAEFARMIADALRRDFGSAPGGIKTVARLTGAEDRAARNWFDAVNGPAGRHLVALMAASDAVLEAVLSAAGRSDLVMAHKIAGSKRLLLALLQQLHDLQSARMTEPLDRFSASDVLSLLREAPMLDPTDVIKTAIHAAFVKHPMEDDPDFSPHWIKPEECAHLAKVIMIELEANGLEIIQKPR